MAINEVAPRRVPGAYAYRGFVSAGDTLRVWIDAVTDSLTKAQILVVAPAGLTITPNVSTSSPDRVRAGTANSNAWAKGPVTGASVSDQYEGRGTVIDFVATGAGQGEIEVVV